MKKNKLFLLVATMFAFVLLLSACGNEWAGTERVVVEDPIQAIEDAMENLGLAISVNNTNPHLEGGILHFALGATSPSIDLLETVFSTWTSESEIREFTHEPLLAIGTDFFPNNDVETLANAYFDAEAKTVTIVKNVQSTWADGVPLTLDDLLFAYEVITHPDYTGPRFDNNMRNVVGAQARRDGLTEELAGVTLSDDKMTLTIEFYDVNPYTFAFGFWIHPMPRHHWEGIEVADMAAHPHARGQVLGNGPFKIVGGVPGESWEFARNDNFWRGPAILDGVVFQVVDPMTAPDVMRAGMFDIVNHPQSLFTEANRTMSNTTFLSNPFNSNANFWLFFRMGDWDEANQVVVPWEEPRLSAPVRKALALAIDHAGAGQELFNGLVVPSASMLWPLNRIEWIDRDLELFNTFNLELAGEILDEAGYVFPYEGAEFRVRPDGSELVVIYLAQTGSVANEHNRQLEMDNWHRLGIDVQYYSGSLVNADVANNARDTHSNFDMMTGGTGFGANPTPSWNLSPNSVHNHARWTSPEWEAAFQRFNSEEMWDPEFVLETVQLMQQVMADDLVMFPTTTALTLHAVNNRVANFSLENTGQNWNVPGLWNTWLWALTAPEPYVAD